jgi:hypothetical protein
MGVPKHSLPEKREKKLKKLINLYENKILILIFFFKKKKEEEKEKKRRKKTQTLPSLAENRVPSHKLGYLPGSLPYAPSLAHHNSCESNSTSRRGLSTLRSRRRTSPDMACLLDLCTFG